MLDGGPPLQRLKSIIDKVAMANAGMDLFIEVPPLHVLFLNSTLKVHNLWKIGHQ
jgi:hypothetical protein